jgi:transcriptional regulator with XRE-family HTH domain
MITHYAIPWLTQRHDTLRLYELTECVMARNEENPEKDLAREVGMLIAQQRKSKGMTQAQLAEYMNLEKETVSRIETGVISPTLVRLAQLAKFLDCEINDFLKIDSPQLTDHARSLAKRMENLNDDQRLILTQLVGKIASSMEQLSPKERKTVEKFLSNVL